MTKPVWTWWSPGEPEDDLHGFLTREDRDACDAGGPGPFKRIVRNPARGPIPPEVLAIRAYLDGKPPFGRGRK